MTSRKNDAPAVHPRFAAPALLTILLAAAIAIAQDTTPRFSETVDVSLINVDVIVTDRKGERVRGLTAEDFVILEEGKPQTIVNFAEYAGDAGEATVSVDGAMPQRRAAEPPPRQPRTFLIFVDEVGLVYAKEDFRPELVETLRRTLQPGDTGAVLTWTNRMNVRQGFTSDLDALEQAIMALPKPGPIFTEDGMFTTFREDEAFWRSIALDPQNAGAIGDLNPVRTLQQQSGAMVAYLDLKSKVRAINASMTAMAGAEGRKVLLLVTHRFSRHPGHQYMTGVRASTAAPIKPSLYHAWDLIESVHQTANATGFTVYGLYPAGIRATMDTAETGGAPAAHDPPVGARDHIILMTETESLDLISDRTGGEYAFGSDALKLLPRVADDLTDYYSLAYRTNSRGVDNRRKIAVRAKNPAYQVRARTEVVERSDKTRMRDRVSAAVFATLDPGILPIRVALDAGKLKIQIPVSALTTVEKNGVHEGAFTVYLAWNAGGTISETVRKTQPFTITAAELAAAKQSHFTYTVDVRTDSGTRALGVGVLDETSKEYGVVQVPVNLEGGRAREQLGTAGAGLDLQSR